MAEWFKAAVLKTVDVNSIRRFESCVLRHCTASAHDKKADAFFFALQSRTCFAVGPVFASGAGRFAAHSCKPAAAAPNPVSSAITWRQHMIKGWRLFLEDCEALLPDGKYSMIVAQQIFNFNTSDVLKIKNEGVSYGAVNGHLYFQIRKLYF